MSYVQCRRWLVISCTIYKVQSSANILLEAMSQGEYWVQFMLQNHVTKILHDSTEKSFFIPSFLHKKQTKLMLYNKQSCTGLLDIVALVKYPWMIW